MYIRNIGKKDRVLRFLLAIIILLVVAFVDFNLTLRWVLGVVGVVLFITAMVNWCPLYSLTNHSSRGQGLDKITKRDIEEAVKEFSLKADENIVEVNIKPQAPSKKASASKKKVTTTKKAPANKTSTAAKKSNKSATKKAPAKKKDATSKKVTSKKAPAKKATTKKASAAKASTKSATKKASTPKKKASTTKKKSTSSKTKK